MNYLRCLQLAFLLLLCSYGSLKAQAGLQVSYIVPTGYYKHIFRPTIGPELVFGGFGDEEARFIPNISVGLYFMRPSQDTFHTVTYVNDYNGTQIKPGFEVIKYYIIVPITFGYDFKILDKSASPFVGAEGTFNLVEYKSHVSNGVINGDSGNLYWSTNFTLKAGYTFIYKEEYSFTAGFGKSFGVIGTIAPVGYWKTYLKVGRTF